MSENSLVQLRARLQERNVKLWEEPYYVENVGSSDSALEQLSQELSEELHMTGAICKNALIDLQDNALRKLAARRHFNETGLATFHVRCVNSHGGTSNSLEVKCGLEVMGSILLGNVAEQLQLNDASHVKCISAGRVVEPQETLEAQGLKNNQQLLVIVGQENAQGEALYERIRQIQRDVELVVDSEHHFMEIEDQDGYAMYLPPLANRALLLGMGLYEKGRAAMRRERYDEALLLFIEADEKFNSCDPKFLESVDNYALLNLDIVWCYLCLKNITQLPDAQRRLDLCEQIFRRTYGENYSRLYALKGSNCPERALILRLHLLQGVILFHQNEWDQARARLDKAGTALAELKVNTAQLTQLCEMGYDPSDGRLALRSCNGNVEQAIQFIQNRRQQLTAARLNSDSERELGRRLAQVGSDEQDWVHPRSVCRLMDQGYERPLVMEALRRTDNDLERSLELLQSHADELRQNLPPMPIADEGKLNTLVELGFSSPTARAALETTQNNLDRAVNFLLKSLDSERDLLGVIDQMSLLTTHGEEDVASTSSSSSSSPKKSTTTFSASTPSKQALVKSVLSKAKNVMESFNAYKRFNEDLPENEQDYLDLPLDQEELILIEYQSLLEH